MTPNYERAATAAAETLIRYRVSAAPVQTLPIIKALPGVMLLSFAELANRVGADRADVLRPFASENRDVVTTAKPLGGVLYYIVAFNQRLPHYILQRAIARELGHIILGHDGSRPQAVRDEEALCFARHLLCPRPLIRAIQDAGIPITIELLGSISGCYERCLAGLQRTEGVRVAPELNRLIREQFADYVGNFVECRSILTNGDDTRLADFGTFMDGYAE